MTPTRLTHTMLSIMTGALLTLSPMAIQYAQALDLGQTDPRRIGTGYGGRATIAQHDVTFSTAPRALVLTVDGFDIDRTGEVDIRLDNRSIGALNTTANDRRGPTLLSLPKVSRGRHTLSFIPKVPTEKWGVRNVRISRVVGPTIRLAPSTIDSKRYGYHFNFGGTQSNAHIGGANLRFDQTDGDVTLVIRGYDIDAADEVSIEFNDRVIGHLRPTANNRLKNTSIHIPRAAQSASNRVRLRVKSLGERWGITRLQLKAGLGTNATNKTLSEDDGGNGFGCSGINITTNERVDETVSSAPAGTTFCIHAGLHRTGEILPKDNQQFICESGAVLSGAITLNGVWVADAGLYRFSGAPLAVKGRGRPGVGRDDAVHYRNDLFVDNQPYRRVLSRNQVNNTAEFFDGELMFAGTFYQNQDRIYLSNDPSGKLVEFGVTTRAINTGQNQTNPVKNGLIENCTFEKYASVDIRAAIDLIFTKDWVVRNVTSRYNHSAGLRTGVGTRVVGGRYVHNGQMGIMGAKDVEFDINSTDNVIIDGVVVAYNNYHDFDAFWHAGGIKFFRTNGVTLTNNRVHHNYGVGIWLDFDVNNALVKNNQIYRNASMGLELEAVFNGAVSENTINCNARIGRHSLNRSWFWGASIMAKNVTGYTIFNNSITTDEGQGIALVDNQDRGSGAYGQRRSANTQIHNNTVRFTHRARSGFFEGRTGVESDADALAAGLDATAPSANNQLYNNTYIFSDPNHTHWRYAGQFYLSNQIPAQWEVSSTFLLQSPAALSGLCD